MDVYLFKGSHHFINCIDYDQIDFADFEQEDYAHLSVLCTKDYETYEYKRSDCKGSDCK